MYLQRGQVEPNATSNYRVCIKIPDGSEKFFPNTAQGSLQLSMTMRAQQQQQNEKADTNISEVRTSEEGTPEIRTLKFCKLCMMMELFQSIIRINEEITCKIFNFLPSCAFNYKCLSIYILVVFT